jgi:hypothetical protein
LRRQPGNQQPRAAITQGNPDAAGLKSADLAKNLARLSMMQNKKLVSQTI